MKLELEELWSEWILGRSHVKAFVQNLSYNLLDRKLPRKGLDTIRKHIEELIQVQSDYIDLIVGGPRCHSVGSGPLE